MKKRKKEKRQINGKNDFSEEDELSANKQTHYYQSKLSRIINKMRIQRKLLFIV